MSLPAVSARHVSKEEGPGPANYTPNQDAVSTAPQRMVFGTSKREGESHRYISSMHIMPPKDSPGPGTYRVHTKEKFNARYKSPPSLRFGSSPQRELPSKELLTVPGPIYNISPERMGPQWTMAPGGRREQGMLRSRDDSVGVFISRLHSQVDKMYLSRTLPGANAYHPKYDINSKSKSCESFSFPKKEKFSVPYASLSRSQLQLEPLSNTMKDSPGPIYNLPSLQDKHTTRFSTSPQTYAPELGGNKGGPVVLKEKSAMGADSPGPGTYKPRTDMGGPGGPTTKFGSPPKERTASKRARLPGPGAYNPREEHSSTHLTSPAFSMAPNLRTEYAGPASAALPGPGQYKASDDYNSAHTSSAKYSLGGANVARDVMYTRDLLHVDLSVPGSTDYVMKEDPNDLKRGYSFAGKEKTRGNTNVSVRYHGPLLALEALGTDSPAPGHYNVELKRTTTGVKFDVGPRAPSQMFISRAHSMAEGLGNDSPGPMAYAADDLTSFTAAANLRGHSFGGGERFHAAQAADAADPYA